MILYRFDAWEWKTGRKVDIKPKIKGLRKSSKPFCYFVVVPTELEPVLPT